MNRGIVVVGAGVGGVRTAEALRCGGYRGEITLVGAERHAPYDRPELSKSVLRGEREVPLLRRVYDDLRVRLVLGVQATSLDVATQFVSLDNGEELEYDDVVIATGARAWVPPGLELHDQAHALRTLDDAVRLRESLRRGGLLTVVGGGFIGCEVAASARGLGCDVVVIEASTAPLLRSVGEAAAAEVTALHQSHGVEFITGTNVLRIREEHHSSLLDLSDRRQLTSETVVLGLGVRPDLAWLDGSGVEIDRGVLCDARGATTAPHVHAVGDVAQWFHPLADAHRVVEHWTSTTEQAEVVADAILGKHPPGLTAAPYFWSDQYGLRIQALGFIDGDAHTDLLTVNGRKIVLYTRDKVLIGALGFSAPKLLMPLRGAIEARLSSSEALAAVRRLV